MAADPRRTRAWRKLRDQVVREEPLCWLKFTRICTGLSETADHLQSVHERPDLAMVRGNLRGACGPCNRARSRTPTSALVVGQPDALRVFG